MLIGSYLFVAMPPASATTPDDEQGTASEPDRNRESLGRATRLLQKFDEDDNGVWDRNENTRAWNRYRKLDRDQNGKLTINELRRDRTGYLETGGERKLDLVYKTVDKKELLLDLYYPTQPDASFPCPLIVYTHGGGWAAGSKQGAANGSFKVVFQQLLDHGFTVASVNYRLCKPNTGVMMRDCVIDSKDAVRYLAQHSETLRLDATKFFVMGDSAGGQIAQMLLLTSPETLPGDKELAATPYTMLAGVSWYGPCDFEQTSLFNHDDRADFRDRFGPRILGSNSSPANKLELYREMSPVNYLRADSHPLLMIQGDKDTTIPVKHAHHMKQKADAIKAPVEVMIIRNAGHNWRQVDADIDPSRDAIVDRTVQFFLDHLPH
ncbi:alpha/beta hydrolase fold domain-containing protein [Rhodopirellula sp. P2]|uniref:alpha/beta hydrolase fold domain-containing protein n=1 Tax=Rhodopirellula sp. P2 TaxID=2127060 RepID=UPI0023679A4A|nr:alpha/beta hydrolase fold domain-containing protein [Rhodopirellula sp. P2]WDQ19521.1 alpha/beta hydrolase fold domain-containing protein [Rhodopirellula sp. P2]